MGDDLVKRLQTVSAMISLGERISWGHDTALMDEAAAKITRLRAQVEALTGALKLADAALSGANMDMKHVWREVKAALAEVQTDDHPCTCCDDTGITHQTERFCSCEAGLAAALATYHASKRETE